MATKILTVPNPILRQKSKPVQKIDKKIRRLITDLIKTVKSLENPQGVGLSAVQIGEPVRIFVIRLNGKFVPFINPQIIWRSKKTFSQTRGKNNRLLEGCLSVPNYYGFVKRAFSAKLAWQDSKGQKHQEKFTGKEAVYLQHESDHLEGILFVDRILEQGGKIYKLEKDKEGKEELAETKL